MKSTILILLFAFSLADNASIIWNYLIKSGMTKAGAAGTMGNLEAESGLVPCIYQTSYKAKLGNISNQEYCNRVNKGTYTAKSFIHDSVGFGLAQWTYYTRKEALLNACRGRIGDLNCQLGYLRVELINHYSGVNSLLISSNNVRECALKVLFDFETPVDQSASVQDYRAGLAQNYYNTFAGGVDPTPGGNTYIVQAGDTLYSIAQKFGTTVEILCRLNNITNPDLIYPGQVLILP